MYCSSDVKWDEEADVVVIGFGGAGSVAAITAHEAGARVVVLEKQEPDTATEIRHTPSTRLSGGGCFSPIDVEKTIQYLEGMVRVANETLSPARREVIAAFAKYAVENTDWLKRIGLKVASGETLLASARAFAGMEPTPTSADADAGGPDPFLVRMFAGVEPGAEIDKVPLADLPALPGAEAARICIPAVSPDGQRNGEALFRALANAVEERGIEIRWATPAAHLVTENSEVRGVIARRDGREVAIKAAKGIILACGGFEYNDLMKENFLRATPAYFTGNPASTGDGLMMAQEVGASLWHMNCCSWRVVIKVPGYPLALNVRRAETGSIFVDKLGRRFTNERFKGHALGYELTNYDAHAMTFPKVPCYWIFDEKRRAFGSLPRRDNRPTLSLERIRYTWSEDNRAEIESGLIMKANSIEQLASAIRSDPDNHDLMTAETLTATIKRYNEYCRQGEDAEFHKAAEYLWPLEDPPFYAIKLWPGGPNTQGGPRRNGRGQVVRPDDTPIGRLYCAGELGSIWGMLYQVGGNIAECVAFGRITGENAASEKRWD